MNKKRVNEWIAPAAMALEKVGVSKNGKVDSTFRGQIAAFGASVTMGSLKAAVAFFAQQGGASVNRELLLLAMYDVITGGKLPRQELTPRKVFSYVCDHDTVEVREQFLDAAIALKLAMNLYDLGKEA